MRSVQQIGVELEAGPVEVEPAAGNEPRRQQARKGQRARQSQFIGVEYVVVVAASCLPLIAAGELHRKLLSAAEDILVGNAESQSGAYI